MHKISETKIFPFSVKQLYNLVIDVDSYHHFLPFCAASKITSKESNNMEADLTISAFGFEDTYSSFVEYNIADDSAEIRVTSTSGPLKHLSNIWKFSMVDETSTVVDFSLEFQLESRILDKMIGLHIDKIRNHMLRAFEKRAVEIYS